MSAVRLHVRVTPRAGRDCIEGLHAGVLRVRLAAPPVEGRANEALVRLLARALDLPARDIRLLRGETARAKLVEIEGLDEREVWRRLALPPPTASAPA